MTVEDDWREAKAKVFWMLFWDVLRYLYIGMLFGDVLGDVFLTIPKSCLLTRRLFYHFKYISWQVCSCACVQWRRTCCWPVWLCGGGTVSKRLGTCLQWFLAQASNLGELKQTQALADATLFREGIDFYRGRCPCDGCRWDRSAGGQLIRCGEWH